MHFQQDHQVLGILTFKDRFWLKICPYLENNYIFTQLQFFKVVTLSVENHSVQ